MTSTAPSPAAKSVEKYSAEKRRVALNSMLAAAAMTVLKLVTGILSGSLGVLSDAVHSGLDLAGAAMTFFSVQVSDLPADEDHTYGHGKIENLSTIGEVILMAVSSVWIIWEAMARIFVHAVELRHSIWPALAVITSIAVDFWRSRRLRAVAIRTGSPALATDAFHFASDIWASLAVLIGLCASWAGAAAGIQWLSLADPLAAIAVSVLILRLTFVLGHEAVGILMDRIPVETRRTIMADVARVPGVIAIEQARVRRSGPNYFADMTLAFPRRYTFEHTGALVQAAKDAVHRTLPDADVVIHTVPREARAESIFDRVRAVAARNNVSVHELSIQSLHGRLRVEQHVELDENLPLRAAHEFVSELEAEILRAAPEIHSVLTHIESEPATIEQPNEFVEEDKKIEFVLLKSARLFPEIIDVHEITVGRTNEHIYVSCHCTLPDDLPMHSVHDIITALEDRFKLECPDVQRVTIHPEPVTDNLR